MSDDVNIYEIAKCLIEEGLTDKSLPEVIEMLLEEDK